MPRQIIIFLIGLIMLTSGSTFGQKWKNEKQEGPEVPRKMVDFPTAAVLPRASFDVELTAFSQGGIVSMINIGLHNRFMLGISFGGIGILGNDKADWNERPEYLVKVHLIDETQAFPAVAVGFESQGTGEWNSDLERYRFKAPGFYGVISKGYRTYGWMSGIHAGINVNPLEDAQDGDDDISFFGGFDITFNNNLTIMGEYQAALNDNRKDSPYGKGNGYLNFSFRWTFSDNLELGFNIKDVLSNSRNTQSVTRELRITYLEHF